MSRTGPLVPYALILPGFLLASLIVLWPLIQLGTISVNDVNRFGQLRGFIGWENYLAVWADPEFLGALGRTLVWTFGIVFGTLVLSFPVSLVLHQDFYGRSLARVIILLPWAVSITMTAIVWRWALNGCGMDEETRKSSVNPFFTTRAVGQGVGMGLTFAHNTIRDMNGSLQLSSEPGQGTTVTICLPLQRAS